MFVCQGLIYTTTAHPTIHNHHPTPAPTPSPQSFPPATHAPPRHPLPSPFLTSPTPRPDTLFPVLSSRHPRPAPTPFSQSFPRPVPTRRHPSACNCFRAAP